MTHAFFWLKSHTLVALCTAVSVIEVELQKAGETYTRIDGTMSMDGRIDAMDAFDTEQCNSMRTPRFILCSLMACGTGINLTRGNVVFLMDPWWNSAVENQGIFPLLLLFDLLFASLQIPYTHTLCVSFETLCDPSHGPRYFLSNASLTHLVSFSEWINSHFSFLKPSRFHSASHRAKAPSTCRALFDGRLDGNSQ